MNEQTKFLEETDEEKKVDILDAPLDIEAEKPKEAEDEDDPEGQPESVKDRRHRRLEERLRAERESNIALNARLETIAEAKKSTTEESDYLKAVERIYGTDSPETIAATELLKTALKGVGEEATRRAIETFREERKKEQEAEKEASAKLDSMIEQIEEENNIDLTSAAGKNLRKGFFEMLQKMSPKDADGNITQYADHHAVWDEYQTRLSRKIESRAKDVAARSMVRSGGSPDTKVQQTAEERYLKDQGII